MKILYLHQYFNTPDMSGGTRSYEIARRLVLEGHEVNLITSRRDCTVKSGWVHEVIDGINVHWLPVPYNNKMGYFERVVAFFHFAFKAGSKAAALGGDLVFATSTPLTIAIPAIKAKNKLGIPMVFEVRDLWPELPIAVGALKSPLLKYFALKLEKWAYRNSEHVICLSPGMCEGVARTGYPKEKIHNIPNSCDISLFNVDESFGLAFRKSQSWLQDKPLVIYAGTLGRINQVGYLVDIAKHFLVLDPDVRFLVVGTGVDEVNIRSRAQISGVYEHNFYMLDNIPKKKMPSLFSAATVSISLCLPLKAIEANSANKFFDTLAAGKPILINYQGWQKELIEEYDAGIVLPNEPTLEAAIMLNSLLKNPENLIEKGKNAFALAEGQFSRDKLVKKLINILESCV